VRPEQRVAALGLALMLAVVLAAAAIRLLGASLLLRAIHRGAASLEILVVLWLLWLTWHARAARPGPFRAALLAAAISVFLSVVGIVFGQTPPPPAAAANLLGGLALTAVFARIVGGNRAFPAWLGAVLAAQIGLGAWLAIVDRWAMALPAHALLALPLAAALAWLGLARAAGARGRMLAALAILAPLAGFTALHYDRSATAALVHAAAAALLLVAAAFALGRRA
jgi:hypothetical protein